MEVIKGEDFHVDKKPHKFLTLRQAKKKDQESHPMVCTLVYHKFMCYEFIYMVDNNLIAILYRFAVVRACLLIF